MFRTTVRAAFAQRRKTLWNNLRAAGYADDALDRVFTKTGIEGIRRAETLSVEEFRLLAAELKIIGDSSRFI
jgi:16S rRNA (adenine1518-N6/adenine1519-N6)-dimethyltransferase